MKEFKKYTQKFPKLYPHEPSIEQLEIIVKNPKNMLVQARAGSGKTTTMICKAHYLHTELKVPTDKIAFIAFNKSAVTDIKDKCRNKGFAEFQNAFTFHSLGLRIFE